jgi:hypothetical protein
MTQFPVKIVDDLTEGNGLVATKDIKVGVQVVCAVLLLFWNELVLLRSSSSACFSGASFSRGPRFSCRCGMVPFLFPFPQVNDTLFRIPPELFMSETTALRSLSIAWLWHKDQLICSMPSLVLGLHMMQERIKGASSQWAPYLNILPSKYDLAITYTVPELDALQPSYLHGILAFSHVAHTMDVCVCVCMCVCVYVCMCVLSCCMCVESVCE